MHSILPCFKTRIKCLRASIAGYLRKPWATTSLATAGGSATSCGIPLDVSVIHATFAAQHKLRLCASKSSAAVHGVQEVQPRQIAPPAFISPPCLVGGITAWENAVVLIDKPRGWTSFDVCAKLRFALSSTLNRKARKIKVGEAGLVEELGDRLAGTFMPPLPIEDVCTISNPPPLPPSKVGHAGTLDPMATGLLVVCVGRATKLVESFMAKSKRYSGTMRLGEGTPSLDAETPVDEAMPWQHVSGMGGGLWGLKAWRPVRHGVLNARTTARPCRSQSGSGGRRLHGGAGPDPAHVLRGLRQWAAAVCLRSQGAGGGEEVQAHHG